MAGAADAAPQTPSPPLIGTHATLLPLTMATTALKARCAPKTRNAICH